MRSFYTRWLAIGAISVAHSQRLGNVNRLCGYSCRLHSIHKDNKQIKEKKQSVAREREKKRELNKRKYDAVPRNINTRMCTEHRTHTYIRKIWYRYINIMVYIFISNNHLFNAHAHAHTCTRTRTCLHTTQIFTRTHMRYQYTRWQHGYLTFTINTILLFIYIIIYYIILICVYTILIFYWS